MRRKLGLSLFASLLLSSFALADEIAITDVEGTYSNKSLNSATNEVKQSINIGFANTTGSSETLNLNAKYDISFITDGYGSKPLKFMFDTTAFMSENAGVKNYEEYTANLDLEQYISDTWLIYTSVNWLRNEFTNYDNKLSMGAGLGNELFNDGTHSFKFKLGLGYNIEEFSNAQAKNEFGSINEYIEYNNKVSDTSKLYIKLGASQNMDDVSNDYEFVTVLGLNVSVSDKLSLSIEEEIRYDGLPPVGFDKTDTKTVVRLGYNF